MLVQRRSLRVIADTAIIYSQTARPTTTVVTRSVADPECARGGGVSHILAEKRGVGFTLFKKNA